MSPKPHIFKTLKYGLEGIMHAIKTERNIRIHFGVAFVVFILGFVIGLSYMEWAVITLSIALVIGLELTNTAIEISWNHLEPAHHPVVKSIKDVMAGAVLVASIGAFIIGIIVFLPYLF